jgi:phage tail-like protein
VLVPIHRPHHAVPVPGATDLEWEDDGVLVAAGAPGEPFERFRLSGGGVERATPLVAHGYDGGGIARGPGGRIAFWTADGLRAAVPARVRYDRQGVVTTFRLDAGEYQAEWGRVFVDACIPTGASLRLTCITTDEGGDDPDGVSHPALERAAPRNLLRAEVRRPDLSPPMPPEARVPAAPVWRPFHRRESGPELAWVRPEEGSRFVTFEAPASVPPGRYLWVALELAGNGRVSPRVRSLRVEQPGHDYLRRLPRAFSREPADADFLRRFLAVADTLVADLENRATYRQALLDPHAAPAEMLPWLASFLGLALDERWPVHARRTLVSEAAWLFRFRGTVRGLSRFLEIYLEHPVVVLEHFRLRGMGAAVLRDDGPVTSRAVLGGGFRIGGALGDPAESPLEGRPADAYALHAHRFTVLVPGSLTDEQHAVVGHVLETHRPAHTLVEVCELGAGMRVGRRLHLGLSSSIGRTAGFHTLQLGGAVLGRGAVVGRPEPGTVPESGRLGLDTHVG